MPDTFTPEQISQILEEFFKVVGTRQYIGARYVPIFGRKGEPSIEWDNTAPYEPLTIVLYQGNSYTSRQFVPVGVEITNQEFWAITGNYNAQIEQYRRETAAATAAADAAQESADNAQADIDTLLPKADFSAESTVKQYIDTSSNNARAAAIEAANEYTDERLKRDAEYHTLSLPVTELFKVDVPETHYCQGMAIFNNVIFVALAAVGTGNTRIAKYDFDSGNLIDYKEYQSNQVGHGNYLTLDSLNNTIVTAGPSNSSVVFIDTETLEIVKTHTVTNSTYNIPISQLAISGNGEKMYVIPQNRRAGLWYYKDEAHKRYSAVTTHPLYFMRANVAQDIAFANTVNFANTIYLYNGAEGHYNYIYSFDVHNGILLREYLVDVPTTVEIEGIYNIGNTTYLIDSAGTVYRCEISTDYRTAYTPLFASIEYTNDIMESFSFANGTNNLSLTPFFMYPYDNRELMESLPVYVRGLTNLKPDCMWCQGGSIAGTQRTFGETFYIEYTYAPKPNNIAYLTRLNVNGSIHNFNTQEIATLREQIAEFVSTLDVTKDYASFVRGVGNCISTPSLYSIPYYTQGD